MPNINISERDASTFADQQFISIAYNGKTNEVGSNAKVLAYRVTFISDNKDYCLVEIGENQKVNIPTPPTKEGYTFKNWLLNGEAFDFSTVITSDITLIAEFEEATAGKTFIFDENSDFFDVQSVQEAIGTVYTIEAQNTLAETITKPVDYMVVDIGDLHCEGIPTLNRDGGYELRKEDSLEEYYIMGVYFFDNSIMIGGQTLTDLSDVTSAKVVITFGEAPAPSAE